MPLNFIYVLTISLHLLLPSPSLRPHDEKYARVSALILANVIIRLTRCMGGSEVKCQTFETVF